MEKNVYDKKILITIGRTTGILFSYDEKSFTVEYDFDTLVVYDRTEYTMEEIFVYAASTIL